MKMFDCSIIVDIPDIEIEANDKEAAKKLYLAAIIRFLTNEDSVLAIELDEVDA